MKGWAAFTACAALAGAGCDFEAATQACLDSGHCLPPEQGADAGGDGGINDAGNPDAGADAGTDAGTDAGRDAGAADAGVDGGRGGDGGASDGGNFLDAGNGPVEVVLSGPAVIDAGQCTPFTLVALNAAGMPTPVGTNTSVSLSVSPVADAGPQFFPNPGGFCFGSPMTAATIPAWFSTLQVGVKGADIGRYTVATTALGQTVQNSLGISAGIPQIIAITSPVQTLQVNGCSAPLRVQLEDGLGDPILAATSIALTFPLATGVPPYYSDLNCMNPTMSVQIASDSGFVDLTFRAASNPTQVIVDAGFWVAVQTETALAGGPTLSFGSAPIVTFAGTCAGPIVLNASVAPGQATPINVVSSTGTTAYFSDFGCSQSISGPGLMSGQISTQFHFIDTHAGALTLNAGATGYAPTVQTESVGPAAPDHYVYLTAPLYYALNACAGPVTIQLLDAYGNVAPTAGMMSCLLSGPVSTVWYSPNCVATINAVSFSPGSSQGSLSLKSTAPVSNVHPNCPIPDGGPNQVELICLASGTNCSQAQACCSGACDAGVCG